MPKIEKEFRLQDHLYLTKYLANKLGIKQIGDIQEFKDVEEGFSSEGTSYMFDELLSRPGRKISEDSLRKYDSNIRGFLGRLKRKRGQQFSLRYYQYLALLFSEIYLDLYFKNPVDLLNDLNDWIAKVNPYEGFSKYDLKKIAYWMATGSGKTLIMHVNYWQFQEYNKGSHKLEYDNIILVTSNDRMSQQHVNDLNQSGIPAQLFDGTRQGYFKRSKDVVKVISIHKLKLPEDKKGEGVTIDISTFGTKNLVFVDEGHKGNKSEDRKWKRTREQLAEDGFTWEYSATFGQIITNEKQESFKEYSKSIIFDYSYKYFFEDGYGKNFHILNLDSRKFLDTQVPKLLLADTISFYEQIKVYKNTEEIDEYNIEKPLWIFVGSKVRGLESDVLTVVKFLSSILNKDKEKLTQETQEILNGKSGILRPDRRDVFTRAYPEKNLVYLREKNISAEEVYEGIFNEIFHLSPGSMGKKLHLSDIKNAEGEIGLKAGASNKYFGVINIGNKRGFLKTVKKDVKDVIIESDTINESLFMKINEKTSLTILIGAKKFIEGWNSWRVSNMSLMNVGKREGPQIIQLFGRGVRLKGKNHSLKRSKFLPPPHPKHVDILETLNVYGVKANYMDQFREVIQKEDVPSYTLELPTKILEPFPEDLQIPCIPEDWSFQQKLINFVTEDEIIVKIDLLPKVKEIDSRTAEHLGPTVDRTSKAIKKEILDLLDWNDLYHLILEHKNERELYNMAITIDSLKRILYEERYLLLCEDELVNPQSFEQLERTKEVVVLILKKYIDIFYGRKRNAAEKSHIQLRPLSQKDENLLKVYAIQINSDDKQLLNYVKKLVNSKDIYRSSKEIKLIGDFRTYIQKSPTTFKNAYFSGHLYQPLLVKQNREKIVTIPTGLNEGETKFVEDLNFYLEQNSIPEKNIYLLRNLTRSRGVGFYETHSFYPDFIMWIKQDQKQKIIFIDPKGITRLGLDHPKLKLHEYLRDQLQQEIGNPNIKLDAFIISVTPWKTTNEMNEQTISIDKYAQEKHLLFQKKDTGISNPNYIDSLFKISMMNN